MKGAKGDVYTGEQVLQVKNNLEHQATAVVGVISTNGNYGGQRMGNLKGLPLHLKYVRTQADACASGMTFHCLDGRVVLPDGVIPF